jgi:hypothetical protein
MSKPLSRRLRDFLAGIPNIYSASPLRGASSLVGCAPHTDSVPPYPAWPNGSRSVLVVGRNGGTARPDAFGRATSGRRRRGSVRLLVEQPGQSGPACPGSLSVALSTSNSPLNATETVARCVGYVKGVFLDHGLFRTGVHCRVVGRFCQPTAGLVIPTGGLPQSLPLQRHSGQALSEVEWTGRDGEICPRTKRRSPSRPDPSTPRCSARDDKKGRAPLDMTKGPITCVAYKHAVHPGLLARGRRVQAPSLTRPAARAAVHRGRATTSNCRGTRRWRV